MYAYGTNVVYSTSTINYNTVNIYNNTNDGDYYYFVLVLVHIDTNMPTVHICCNSPFTSLSV